MEAGGEDVVNGMEEDVGVEVDEVEEINDDWKVVEVVGVVVDVEVVVGTAEVVLEVVEVVVGIFGVDVVCGVVVLVIGGIKVVDGGFWVVDGGSPGKVAPTVVKAVKSYCTVEQP